MGKSKDAFRTISEVAEWLDTQAHVLRFWESKFTQVKPVKRAGGRRYYRPADMRLLGGIKKLLHDDGMTIKGAQKLLREKGVKHVAALSPPLDDEVQDVAVESAQIETQPPDITPAEVLSFTSKPEPVAQPSETEDVSEMTGDLFPIHPQTEDDAHAADAAQAPEEEDTALPGQDELPAFLQRVTFDTVSDDQDDAVAATPDPEPDTEATPAPEPDAPSAPAPVAEEVPEATTDAPELPASENEPIESNAVADQPDRPSMEPGPSLLPNLVATRHISPENREEARALVAKLTDLRNRMAESENA